MAQETKSMKHIVTQEQAGARLDVFLTAILPECSRSQIQKMVKAGSITVNEKNTSPHHFLKVGDVVHVGQGEAPLAQAERLFTPRIIAETPEYIVLDKPAGLIVHAGVKKGGHTLVDWILEHYPEIRKIGDDPVRPGIVHRLDKDASGVMVVARTQESFESLVRQFKLRQVKKEYQILVYGEVTPREGVIDLPIGRSKQQYTRRAAHVSGGRPAITRYAVLAQLKGVSLARVVPETGRTHQIRVHFFAKGNPVVGDAVYISKKIKPIAASRLMLHAERLGFRDLSGAWQEYTVAPDENFQKMIGVAPNR